MRKTLLFCAALLLGACALVWRGAPAAGASAQAKGAQDAFFSNLKKLCGKKFEGATNFPANAEHPLAGKRLVMHIETCGEREIRIPFHIAEDRSRTWVLTMTAQGLLFKHDHRHADGTPDRVTMYGGLAALKDGTARTQRFPADARTAELIPEAKTNVWTLEISADGKRFMYYLERNNEPRYRAYFDLGKAL
ncbi:MAG: hypothetical protein H7Z38_15305 [Rubrivivax sp.]|nr:hypothetical protein [Pyrinomonadaceae bacterium]